MRRLLLTTALVSLAFIPGARAELEVTVGGYVDFQAAAFDNDVADNSGRDFQSESEVHVKANAKTENGLEYGAYIEMQTSTSDTVAADEVNLYLMGSWGKIELGDQDGAGSVLTEHGPYVGVGQVYAQYTDYVPAADRGYAIGEGPGDSNLKAIDSADASKITYYTPRISGLQLGVSYAPERDNEADGEGVQFSNATGNHDNMFEFAANYKGTISGVGVKIGGEYNIAEAKNNTLEDIRAWSLGGQLSYNHFNFGGGYTDDGDSGLTKGVADNDVTKWNVGLTYTPDAPWAVGISYAYVDLDEAGTAFGSTGVTGSGGEYTAWGFGGTYKIAPGLTTGADLVYFDRNRVTGTDTDGYVLLTEVRAAF